MPRGADPANLFQALHSLLLSSSRHVHVRRSMSSVGLDSALLDLGAARSRVALAALAPALLVLALCAVHAPLPLPRPIRKLAATVRAPFAPFLSLREAEGLLQSASVVDNADADADYNVEGVLTAHALLVLLAMAQCAFWMGVAAFSLVMPSALAWPPALISATWLYDTLRVAAHRGPTPPYALFVLYLLHFVGGALLLGGALFEYLNI
ncbi:hypothetical protein FB451DRAFT_1451098 [Mycena latifolia]|nr:hypothetical protein FB451DRAFT_1451098 [Mycena latifolia]